MESEGSYEFQGKYFVRREEVRKTCEDYIQHRNSHPDCENLGYGGGGTPLFRFQGTLLKAEEVLEEIDKPLSEIRVYYFWK